MMESWDSQLSMSGGWDQLDLAAGIEHPADRPQHSIRCFGLKVPLATQTPIIRERETETKFLSEKQFFKMPFHLIDIRV